MLYNYCDRQPRRQLQKGVNGMVSLLNNDELFRLNQLFAGLYEDENYQKSFMVFLENLKELVKFQKGDVYFYKNEGEHINFEDFIFVDWGDGYLDRYINEYADIDDALPIVSLKQPVMFRSSDVFIPDERMKTKYYNELLLPAGMQHSIEGNIYMGDDGYVAGIGIHRPDELGDFSPRDLEIMKLSRPHLVNVARKFLDRRSEIDAYALGLTALNEIEQFGIVVFGSNFAIEESNLTRNGVMRQENLGEMVRSLVTMCKSLHDRMRGGASSEEPEDNKVSSRITIGHDYYYAEIIYKEISPGSGKYIATVYDHNKIFERFIDEIRTRFGLTEREFEILKCVMKGMNNAEIGRELFISVPTVKKHLTNIYQKLGIEGKHQILSVIIE